MPLKIVRNDITRMDTEAIVNTAGSTTEVGAGCDIAIYRAAGYEKLHALREEIGDVPEGEVFITPGYDLPAKYIIHAVSPYYIDGQSGEEEKLRNCYRKSLKLACEKGIRSISFPIIATGSFGYPRAHGLRIAVDEINRYLMDNEMDVYLVVFDSATTDLAEKIYPQIEAFIQSSEARAISVEEYDSVSFCAAPMANARPSTSAPARRSGVLDRLLGGRSKAKAKDDVNLCSAMSEPCIESRAFDVYDALDYEDEFDYDKLKKRVEQIADTFGHYVMYLADRKSITLTTLEHTAWIHKNKVSNVRNKPDTYRPDKRTALQFAVGLELSLDDTRDLLARAGYALSPSYLEDVIWETFIEAEHYDIFDISDTLEKYGFKPIVTDF